MAPDEVPAQWDDELSSWPEHQGHAASRRIAFVTICGILIMLIILTLLFVGNDKKSSAAKVETNGTTSTSSASLTTDTTVGFATSLPVAITATSFGTTTTSTDTTLPSSTDTTTDTTTVTTSPPRFFYSPSGPRIATAVGSQYSGGNPNCVPKGPTTFDTPSPGTLTITRSQSGITASGPVQSNGDFDISGQNGGTTERFIGNTTQTNATGTLVRSGNTCNTTAAAVWTFS